MVHLKPLIWRNLNFSSTGKKYFLVEYYADKVNHYLVFYPKYFKTARRMEVEPPYWVNYYLITTLRK